MSSDRGGAALGVTPGSADARNVAARAPDVALRAPDVAPDAPDVTPDLIRGPG